MSDEFSVYERRLEALRAQLPAQHPRAWELTPLAARLSENLSVTRTYGDSERLRAERAEIITRLDQLVLEVLGIAFTALEATPAQPPQSRQPETPRSAIDFGTGNRIGNVSIGDIAGRDIRKTEINLGDRIQTGDISGSGIAIGRGAQSNVRNVNTGGGDYAEGNIDKRSGAFVGGDQFNMAGNFSGANVNIKSTLSNVVQSIGAAQADPAARSQLQTLVDQLGAELQQLPPAQSAVAEALAELVRTAVEHALKPQPNPTLVQLSLAGLTQTAQSLAEVRPAVPAITTQLSELLRRLAAR